MFLYGNAKHNLLSKKENKNKYYNHDYVINLDDDNNTHSIIINNIKKYKKILDIGCGPGYIGKTIKSIDKNKYIDGIEIDEEARKVASNYYDHLYSFSVEDTNNDDFKLFFKSNRKYNCIVLADVIEHLINPGEVLFRLSKKLENDGIIIISTPNIAHIDIITNLINGNFNYNTVGLLDSTHVRFFTERSFFDFISNINEKYNIKFGVKTLKSTYAAPNRDDDLFISDVVGDDIYKFQNIFIISESFNTKKIKNKNDYKIINNKYIKLLNDLNNANDIIKKLNKIIKEKDETIKYKDNVIICKDEQIKGILNSRSWKLTKPLRMVKKIIKRRNNK